MGLFKRKIEYVLAICPKCKGNLHLDATLETAYCQYCGAECIIENAKRKEKKKNKLETVLDFFERQQALKRKEKKQNKLETVLDFFERQQALRRQEQKEREEKIEREEKERKLHIKKYWWVYLLIIVVLCFFIFLTEI